MTARHMLAGLKHKYAGLSLEDFFVEIDKCGGWPLGFKFVGFEHTDERAAGFCNESHNTGWWTTIASSDDYYLWKLSPEALQRIVDAVVDAIRLPRPAAHKLSVRSWRDGKAPLQQPKEKAS